MCRKHRRRLRQLQRHHERLQRFQTTHTATDSEVACLAARTSRGHGGWSSLLLAAAVLAVLATGCGPLFLGTTLETEEVFDLALGDLHDLAAETYNGGITIRARHDGRHEAHVKAVIRARGQDEADARACLAAVEMRTPVSSDSPAVQQVGWGWKSPHREPWSVEVSLELEVPEDFNLRAKTHNGSVRVEGVRGVCRLETHNGSVTALDAAAAGLAIKTHNGTIHVRSACQQVDLLTHNGNISSALTSAQALAGSIRTHNGGIELGLEPTAAVAISCRTVNGSVRSELKLAELTRETRQELVGKLNAGGDSLSVSTHNGRIRLQPAAKLDLEEEDDNDDNHEHADDEDDQEAEQPDAEDEHAVREVFRARDRAWQRLCCARPR